jgi:hypothetical protein
MAQQQRQPGAAAGVQEVDLLPVNNRGELRDRIQPRRPVMPVIPLAPVRRHLAHPVPGHAVVPPGSGQLIGPAGQRQPGGQIIKICLRNVNGKRL